jgi:hypothetical protein
MVLAGSTGKVRRIRLPERQAHDATLVEAPPESTLPLLENGARTSP